MDRRCALHDSVDHDVRMQAVKHIAFNEDRNSDHGITPYSETYHMHPHSILATATGWKVNPSRAHFFTGKSTTVVQARRNIIRKAMKPKAARRKEVNRLGRASRAAINSRPPPSTDPRVNTTWRGQVAYLSRHGCRYNKRYGDG